MQPDLSAALAILRREVPDLAAVYLFGSAATGTARVGSDVDLAFVAGRPVAHERLLDLRQLLANSLNQDVDLVDLAAANTILQIQVINEGRVIDTSDPDAAALFELRAIREYQDLKERRRGVEADIVARGRVHA
jgi:predicted nucleotidyltransferase